MLNPVNQIGTPSLQVPLALLRQRPADDWLRAETYDLEVLSAPRRTAAVHPLSRVPLAFLRRLVVDDRLRAELETDPVGTLERHGVHVPPEAIPTAVSLPSSQALHQTLRAYATEEESLALIKYVGWVGGFVDGLLDGLFGDD